MIVHTGNAQIFQVDTLQYKGASNKYINIVIMGDGYMEAEQNHFIADATYLSNYLFAQSPWSNYMNYFNVFAIKVISAESGTKHPNSSGDCASASPSVPVSNPSTYLGCSFDSYGIHRLVVPTNTSNLVNVLATNIPNYDQVLVIANSPYYGASGGSFATSTVNEFSNEITSHEIGHSFANLADEYYAGDIYASEKPNMTQQTNADLVKWKNWMGHSGVGIYQHCCGGSSALWYKPHTSCKMEALGNAFCSVCKEAIIEKIHSFVNPVVSYTPTESSINSTSQFIDFKLTKLMRPSPNTLNIIWKLNGVAVLSNLDSIQIDQSTLPDGIHTLSATVVDTSTLLRVNNHATMHFSTITWNISKSSTGVQLKSAGNKITCSIFPNPSSDRLNISIELGKKSKVAIQLISIEGNFIEQVANETLVDKNFMKTIDIGHLANGVYALVFKLGDFIHTQTFVKQ